MGGATYYSRYIRFIILFSCFTWRHYFRAVAFGRGVVVGRVARVRPERTICTERPKGINKRALRGLPLLPGGAFLRPFRDEKTRGARRIA